MAGFPPSLPGLNGYTQLSGRAASNLSRTLRHMERHGLVKLHRSPDTRAVRPEALATEFLVVLD